MSQSFPQFRALYDEQKRFFESGKTRSREFRAEQLAKLKKSLEDNEQLIVEALAKDLGKPELEAVTGEIAVILGEIKHAKGNLRRWMRPRCVRTPMNLWPGKTRVISEPLGQVLVIGPWNYPLQLALTPLVGAIAAGNCAIVKPSEVASHSAQAMAKILSVFPQDYIAVVEGGVPETTELLKIPFNHIFFTGSTKVGKIVYEAAAKNLTPVTLELGGKSPVIVCDDADLDLAARRIAWGRFSNAGQTCIAPDYVYADKKIASQLMEKIKARIEEFYGANAKESPSYGRIINEANHQRLSKMIDAKKVFYGGQTSVNEKYIDPTILHHVTWNDPSMQEEIFGPILPVMEFESVETAFYEISKRDKPLAAYIFTDQSENKKKFLQLSFGGGSINDTVVHFANPYAPFGGVGASGLGAYHGDRSFEVFSHQKTVVSKSKWFDFSVRYPPYSKKKQSFLRWLIE